MRIEKNNISYFQAGFKAGMIIAGVPKEEVKRKFYETIIYPNIVIKCFNDYETGDDDLKGTLSMFIKL